jgi:hypothetical protein
MARDKQDPDSRSDAIFLGWQQTKRGESIALYNIIAVDHPLRRSTVTQQTLERLNLKVPRPPLHFNKP